VIVLEDPGPNNVCARRIQGKGKRCVQVGSEMLFTCLSPRFESPTRYTLHNSAIGAELIRSER